MLKIGDKCKATDQFGSFHNEPVTVIGFKTNLFGRELVRVWRDSGGETSFYPNELRKE